MTVLTEQRAEVLERDAVTRPLAGVAQYLQDELGQRMAAHLAGLKDARQIGRYARGERSASANVERRLREGFKAVQMIVESYDAKTAKAWLFGTNSRLDDRAPIDILGQAESTDDLALVVRAARQFASIEAALVHPDEPLPDALIDEFFEWVGPAARDLEASGRTAWSVETDD